MTVAIPHGRVVLLVTALLLGGCTRFEHPVISESAPALDEALIGHWRGDNGEYRVELEVARNGAEGKVRLTLVEGRKQPETGELRLITGRTDARTFGQVLKVDDLVPYWRVFRYQLDTPDRVTLYLDNLKFWTEAVKNRELAGNMERAELGSAHISASTEEVSAFVQKYGAVIFDEEPLFELTRE